VREKWGKAGLKEEKRGRVAREGGVPCRKRLAIYRRRAKRIRWRDEVH